MDWSRLLALPRDEKPKRTRTITQSLDEDWILLPSNRMSHVNSRPNVPRHRRTVEKVKEEVVCIKDENTLVKSDSQLHATTSFSSSLFKSKSFHEEDILKNNSRSSSQPLNVTPIVQSSSKDDEGSDSDSELFKLMAEIKEEDEHERFKIMSKKIQQQNAKLDIRQSTTMKLLSPQNEEILNQDQFDSWKEEDYEFGSDDIEHLSLSFSQQIDRARDVGENAEIERDLPSSTRSSSNSNQNKSKKEIKDLEKLEKLLQQDILWEQKQEPRPSSTAITSTSSAPVLQIEPTPRKSNTAWLRTAGAHEIRRTHSEDEVDNVKLKREKVDEVRSVERLKLEQKKRREDRKTFPTYWNMIPSILSLQASATHYTSPSALSSNHTSSLSNPTNCIEVLLSPASEEFRSIEKMVNSNIGKHGNKFGTIKGVDPVRFAVSKIYRVQNEDLWRRFLFAKSNIEANNHFKLHNAGSSEYLTSHPILTPLLDPAVNEYYLFHGTKWDVIDIVKNRGFDERVGAVNGMFGAGIYFAENSSKSNQYIPCPVCGNGSITSPSLSCNCPPPLEYGLLLCRVVLGDIHIATEYNAAVYKGEPQNPVRRPPIKSNVTHELYDSVLGECQAHGSKYLKYREFVVYDRYQVYPEYIIHYQRVPPVANEGDKVEPVAQANV